MNPDYFRKLFKKEMGISPLKYLTQIRISHAKRLLRLKHRSGMSIQEISWLSGFQDSLYFSRVFKKVTGVPPQDWEWIFYGIILTSNGGFRFNIGWEWLTKRKKSELFRKSKLVRICFLLLNLQIDAVSERGHATSLFSFFSASCCAFHSANSLCPCSDSK